MAERFQRLALLGAQIARDKIDDAQRAYRVAIRCNQRRAGIKTNVGVFGDQRIIDETFVGERVGNHHHSRLRDHVAAEGYFALGFMSGCAEMLLEAEFRLEPLTVRVDQADERDGSSADLRGQAG